LVSRYRGVIHDPQKLDEHLDIHMNNVLEDYHAHLESSFVPLLDKAIQHDISFYTDDQSVIHFLYFVCTQYMRTNGVRARIINDIQQKNGQDLTRIWPLLSNMFSFNIGGSLFVERRRRRLILLRNNSGTDFITGDQPIINLYANNGAPVHKMSFYYPISPCTALILSEVDESPLFTTESLTAAQVSLLNAKIFEASHRQVFAREESSLHLSCYDPRAA
jgi:hypothetical protein